MRMARQRILAAVGIVALLSFLYFVGKILAPPREKDAHRHGPGEPCEHCLEEAVPMETDVTGR